MKSSYEYLEPTKVKLTVEVPFEEFKPAIDAAAKEIGKQVSIPGFRKGHVPSRVLEAQFGRGALVQEAVNNNLDSYYVSSMRENDLVPLSRPEVEVTAVPIEKNDTSALVFDATVDVRPAIVLPDPATLTLTVDSVAVSDEDVEERLTSLRERFGTLKDVDRPAKEGDFLTIDMTASIEGEDIDSVSGVSYKVGSGTMLPTMDEHLVGVTAGETVTFTDKLAGGEHEGEEAGVTIIVCDVKESELPEADDDFAQLASEFDTISELREDLREQVGKDKRTNQVHAARDLLLEELRKVASFPIPESVVETEVASHLEREGKPADDPHADEIREEIVEVMRDQFILDTLAEAFETRAEQNELYQFLLEQAQMYGMDPNQFVQAAVQTNQIGAFAQELTRGKALISALRLTKVVDGEGTEISVTEVVGEAPEEEATPDFAALKVTAQERAAKAAAAAKPATKSATKKTDAKAGDKEAVVEAEIFDPSTKKVDEVLAYVAQASEEEKARVLEAEKAGKARKTLLEKLQG